MADSAGDVNEAERMTVMMGRRLRSGGAIEQGSYLEVLKPSKNVLNSSRSSVILHVGMDLRNDLP